MAVGDAVASLLSDISSDIRVICMGELGCWVRLYPDLFLDNNYLKYIGWMLYDKVRGPRCSAPNPKPRVRSERASCSHSHDGEERRPHRTMSLRR